MLTLLRSDFQFQPRQLIGELTGQESTILPRLPRRQIRREDGSYQSAQISQSVLTSFSDVDKILLVEGGGSQECVRTTGRSTYRNAVQRFRIDQLAGKRLLRKSRSPSPFSRTNPLFHLRSNALFQKRTFCSQ